MTKLTNLKPALSSMAPRLNVAGPADERSRSALRNRIEVTRRWYNCSRWRKLRLAVLLRDRYTCQMCGRLEPRTSKLVCDHVSPHRGDEQKFWSGPFQTLCATCHSSKKQAEERRDPTPRGTWY
ncbi:HNH endonuclease [Mesorhizobium australicum]|uniref:HNH endonuclease n=1 Tax=Mesorhizobium australicum TaxID=536018 RepID=UPI003339DC49